MHQPEHRVDASESVSELVEQLGRDTSRLIKYEAALGASQRAPELRRAALGAAAAVVVVLAFVAAFALANWAAVSGLSSVVSTWLAALILAAGWLVVGAALLAVLIGQVRRSSGVDWWRMQSADRQRAMLALEASRDEAEQALRNTIERLTDAIGRETKDQLADALMPLAGAAVDIGEEVLADLGDELIEASEHIVEAIEEDLPAGSAVGQMVDLVLLPGRLCIRVATTVLRGDSNAAFSSASRRS